MPQARLPQRRVPTAMLLVSYLKVEEGPGLDGGLTLAAPTIAPRDASHAASLSSWSLSKLPWVRIIVDLGALDVRCSRSFKGGR